MSLSISLESPARLLIVYFILITILTFFFFGYDKLNARMKARRVREIILWFLALIGGSAGALIGMRVFRHKTKKLSFQAVLALILAAQAWVAYLLLR